MKYLAFGDLHSSKYLKNIEALISIEKPGCIISTGDLDSVETIREYINFEDKCKKEGLKVITICGNHEHAIFFNNMEISSPEMTAIGKTSEDLHKELANDPIAYGYIKNLVSKKENIKGTKIFLDEQKYSKKFPALIIHGALRGNSSTCADCPNELKSLWNRLEKIEDYRKNFAQMQREAIKIMIRGHDHDPIYAYSENNNIKIHKSQANRIYYLKESRLHTINPGSLSDGLCAIIDTQNAKEPNLKYISL